MANQKLQIDILANDRSKQAFDRVQGSLAKAKAAGFELFAWCDSDEKIAPKRPRGKKKADQWRSDLPKLVVLGEDRYITCPEIRRGRGVVTCTKSKNSVNCQLCVQGLANVLFPSH